MESQYIAGRAYVSYGALYNLDTGGLLGGFLKSHYSYRYLDIATLAISMSSNLEGHFAWISYNNYNNTGVSTAGVGINYIQSISNDGRRSHFATYAIYMSDHSTTYRAVLAYGREDWLITICGMANINGAGAWMHTAHDLFATVTIYMAHTITIRSYPMYCNLAMGLVHTGIHSAWLDLGVINGDWQLATSGTSSTN